ncbi:probable copper-transporting ATPase HMA5 [Hevea brasiliensis]|uniref:probable copper-transporting ATPase HMA5 n=1 Tax=Hevea brasiliensis TaxID=3981 RepID=UPI0025E9AF65|nr:probable copper-transporting ATPase HMA5 [Hevea brasiliensis]
MNPYQANSRHPLAKAIIEHAKECGEDKDNFLLPEAHDFDSIAGRGLKAIVQSKQILVGNKSLMIEHNISIPDDAKKKLAEIERKGQTGVLVSIDSELTGIVAISDPLKPGAREVISILKSMKVRTIMATGDNWGTANSICRQVGIETFIAEANHQQKVKEVEKLQDQGHAVAMVDVSRSNSLALAAADVGIAVGARTGIAMEAADINLTKDNLEDVVTAIDLSRKTISLNHLNLVCACVHNFLGISMATAAPFLLGFILQPWIAGMIATCSSLGLVMSPYLLKKYKRPKKLENLEIHGIRVDQ